MQSDALLLSDDTSLATALLGPSTEEKRSFCYRLQRHATESMGSCWSEKDVAGKVMYAFEAVVHLTRGVTALRGCGNADDETTTGNRRTDEPPPFAATASGADPATAVSDDRLGAAAAESTCWSRTALPRDLADVPRERAVAHIRDATISF